MENKAITKQIRHQSAKKKYQTYQRALSHKFIDSKASDTNLYIPKPGNFAILKNNSLKKLTHQNRSYSKNIVNQSKLPRLHESSSTLTLTKNINEITKHKNSGPLDSIVHELANKKIPKKKLELKKRVSGERKGRQSLGQREVKEEEERVEYFKRPISAKIYEQIKVRKEDECSFLVGSLVKKGKDEEFSKKKKQTNYSRKLHIPKHIYGYKTIDLFPKQKHIPLPDNQPLSQSFSPKNRFPHLQRKFLPIQYYLIEYETEKQIYEHPGMSKEQYLMEKYRNTQDGKVRGFSRWQYTDGRCAWRKCTVEGYDSEEERWVISWAKGDKENVEEIKQNLIKKVSRNNLCFEGENFQKFSKMVEEAQKFRKQSQGFLKYNTLIDLMKTQTSLPSQSALNKIIKLVKQPKLGIQNQQGLSLLLEEVKTAYIRAEHQFEFNITLPFNRKYKEVFQGILPNCIFDPNPRIMINYTQNQNPEQLNHSTPKTRQIFGKGLKKLQEKSHLTSRTKIQIFQLINQMGEQFLNPSHQSYSSILNDYSKGIRDEEHRLTTHCYSLGEWQSLLTRNMQIFIFTVNHKICDIEYILSKQIDPIYQNRKTASKDQYEATMVQFAQFCKVVNTRIEVLIREKCSQIIDTITQSLCSAELRTYFENIEVNKLTETEILNFLSLPFNKNIHNIALVYTLKFQKSQLQICPPINSLFHSIQKIFTHFLSQLTTIKCVSKSYLPEIRPKNLLSMNLPTSPENLNKMLHQNLYENNNNPIFMSYSKLLSALKINEDLFESFTKMVRDKLDAMNNLYLEISKKAGKKIFHSEISQIINQVLTLKNWFDQVLYLDERYFGVTSLVLNLKQLREQIPKKLQDLLVQISRNVIIAKILRDNQKIEKAIEKTLQIIYKPPETIQQFVSLQTFLHVQLVEEIDKIKSKCFSIQEKFKLIDEMAISDAITPSQFENCYRPYTTVLKLIQAHETLLLKLDEVYRKNFIEQVLRDRNSVIEKFKKAFDMLQACMQHCSLQQMDNQFKNYLQTQAFLQNLEEECKQLINHEIILKLSSYSDDSNSSQNIDYIVKNEFPKLQELRQCFWLPYTLISLHKNYKLSVLPILEENIMQSQMENEGSEDNIGQNIKNSIEKLEKLLSIKSEDDYSKNDFKFITPSVSNKWLMQKSEIDSILQQYREFQKYLKVIGVFRSKHLRQRHWKIIQKIVEDADKETSSLSASQKSDQINILTRKNLGEILKIIFIEAKPHENPLSDSKIERELLKISAIAVQELAHEKKYYLLKREWKEVKASVSKSSSGYKNISNIQVLINKIEDDCMEVQKILESPYVTFLEEQIIQWKDSTLKKIHDLLEIWPSWARRVEETLNLRSAQIYPYLCKVEGESEVSRKGDDKKLSKMLEYLERQHNSLITSIEFQCLLIDVVNNPKTDDYLDSINASVQGIWVYVRSIARTIQHKNFDKLGKLLKMEEILQLQMIPIPDSEQYLFKKLEKCWGIEEIRIFLQRNQQTKYSIKCVNELKDQLSFHISFPQLKNEKDLTVIQCFDFFNEFISKVSRDAIKKMKSLFSQSLQSRQNQGDKILPLQLQVLKLRMNFTQEVQKFFKSLIQKPEIDLFKELRQRLTIRKRKIWRNMEVMIRESPLKIYEYMQRASVLIMEVDIQIGIMQELLQKRVSDKSSFQWQKQIRYYQDAAFSQNSKVDVNLVNQCQSYEFEFINAIPLTPYSPVSYEKVLVSTIIPLLSGQINIISTTSKDRLMDIFLTISSYYGRALEYVSCLKIDHLNTQIEQIIKMAACGVFIVLTELQQISLAEKNRVASIMKTYQIQFELERSNALNSNRQRTISLLDRNGKQMRIFPDKFWFAGISQNSDMNKQEDSRLRQFYREISYQKIDASKIIQMKLHGYGLISQQANSLFEEIDVIIDELQCRLKFEALKKQSSNLTPVVSHTSRDRMVGRICQILTQRTGKFFQKRIKEKEQQSLQKIEDGELKKLIRDSVEHFLAQNMNPEQNSELKNRINEFWNCMSKLRVLTFKRKQAKMYKLQASLEQPEQNPTKKIKMSLNKLLQENLILKEGIVIVGSIFQDREWMQALEESQKNKFIFHSINPLGYFKEELYGMQCKQVNAEKSCGIFKNIVDELDSSVRASSQADNSKQVYGIIHISSSLWLSEDISWIRKYIASSENAANLKLVIEISQLSLMSPGDLQDMYILLSKTEEPSREVSENFFNDTFKGIWGEENAKDQISLEQINHIFHEITEPLFEFYISLIHGSKSQELKNNLSFKNPFESQVHQNFSKAPFLVQQPSSLIKNIIKLSSCLFSESKQHNDEEQAQNQSNKNYPPIINILFFASLAVLGHTLPEEYRRLLSRHLRYILQQIDLDIVEKHWVDNREHENKKPMDKKQKGWTIQQIYGSRMKEENIYEFYYCPRRNLWYQSLTLLPSPQNRNKIFFPQYIILKHHLQRYFSKCIPTFVVGESHSSKLEIFKDLFGANIDPQSQALINDRKCLIDLEDEKDLINKNKYEVQVFPCTKFTNKSPISIKMLKSLRKHGYSHYLQGIANYKVNIYFIEDLEMDYCSPDYHGCIQQYLSEFIKNKGFYLGLNKSLDNHLLTRLLNLQFFGTISLSNTQMNQLNHQNTYNKFLRFLSKNVSLVLMPVPQNRVQSILRFKLSQTCLTQVEINRLIKCTINFYESIIRDSPQLNTPLSLNKTNNEGIIKDLCRNLILKFQVIDMIKVIEVVRVIISNLEQNQEEKKASKHEAIENMGGVLRIWAYSVQKIFNQKIKNDKNNEGLFYFLNNTLMEEERLRYKEIVPSSNQHILRMSPYLNGHNKFSFETVETILLKILQRQVLIAQRQDNFNQNKFLILYQHSNALGNQICIDFVKKMLKIWGLLCLGIKKTRVTFLFNPYFSPVNSILKAVSLCLGMQMFEPNGTDSQIDRIKHEQEGQISLKNRALQQKINYLTQKYSFCSSCSSSLKSMMKNSLQYGSSDSQTASMIVLSELSPFIHGGRTQDGNQHRICRNNMFESLHGFQKMQITPMWLMESVGDSLLDDYDLKTENNTSTKNPLSKKLGRINFIVAYNRIPEEIIEKYNNLIEESTIIFLKNTVLPKTLALTSIRNLKKQPIMMTDLREHSNCQEELEKQDTCSIFKNSHLNSEQLLKYLQALGKSEEERQSIIHSFCHIYTGVYQNYKTRILNEVNSEERARIVINERLPLMHHQWKKLTQCIKKQLQENEQKHKITVSQLEELQPIFMEEQREYNKIKTEIQVHETRINNLTLEYQQKIKPYKEKINQVGKSLAALIQKNHKDIKSWIAHHLSNLDQKNKWTLQILSLLVGISDSQIKAKSLQKNKRQSVNKSNKNYDPKNSIINSLSDPKVQTKISKINLHGMSIKVTQKFMKQIETHEYLLKTQEDIPKKAIQDDFFSVSFDLIVCLAEGVRTKLELMPIEQKVEVSRQKLEKSRKKLKKVEALKTTSKGHQQSNQKKIKAPSKIIQSQKPEAKIQEIQEEKKKISDFKTIYEIFETYEHLCKEKQRLEANLSEFKREAQKLEEDEKKIDNFLNQTLSKFHLNKEWIHQDGPNQEQISLYSVKMTLSLLLFNQLLLEKQPNSIIEDLSRKIVRGQNCEELGQEKQEKQNNSWKNEFEQLSEAVRKSLRNYKGCVLFKNNEKKLEGKKIEESEMQIQREKEDSFQLSILKRVLLGDKFQEISYEELIEDVRKIQQIFEANLTQLSPTQINDFREIFLKDQIEISSENSWLQYYQSPDKKDYWKRHKNLQIHKNLIETFLEVAQKGPIVPHINGETDTSAYTQLEQDTQQPLIIRVPSGINKHISAEKVENVLRILELYGSEFKISLNNRKILGNNKLKYLKNRLIMICAQDFKKECQHFYPFIDVQPRQKSISPFLNWKNKELTQFQLKQLYQKIYEACCSEPPQQVPNEKNQEVLNEQRKNIVVQIAKLGADVAQLDLRMKQIIKKTIKSRQNYGQVQKAQQFNALQHKFEKFKQRCAYIEELVDQQVVHYDNHEKQINEEEQEQERERQKDKKFRPPKEFEIKLEKITYPFLQFFKIISTASQSSIFRIQYEQYLQNTVIPLFKSHFLKKTKIKSQKQYETTLQHQLTKLEKQLVPALYEKYAGILMGLKNSHNAQAILLIGCAGLNNSIEFEEKIVQVNLFEYFLRQSFRYFGTSLDQKDVNLKIREAEEIFGYYFCHQSKKIQISQQNISEIINKHIRKFVTCNQYPWQAYLNKQQKAQLALLNPLPKIVILYLITLLCPQELEQCLRNIMNNLNSKYETNPEGSLISRWVQNKAYSPKNNDIAFFDTCSMDSLSLSKINENIYQLTKCKNYVTLPLHLLPSNYLQKYVVQEGQILKAGSKNRLIYISQVNFSLKKNKAKTVPEEDQIESTIKSCLSNDLPLLVISPDPEDIQYLIGKFRQVHEEYETQEVEINLHSKKSDTKSMNSIEESSPKLIFLYNSEEVQQKNPNHQLLHCMFPTFRAPHHSLQFQLFRKYLYTTDNQGYEGDLLHISKKIVGKQFQISQIPYLSSITSHLSLIAHAFWLSLQVGTQQTNSLFKLKVLIRKIVEQHCFRFKQTIMNERGKKTRTHTFGKEQQFKKSICLNQLKLIILQARDLDLNPVAAQKLESYIEDFVTIIDNSTEILKLSKAGIKSVKIGFRQQMQTISQRIEEQNKKRSEANTKSFLNLLYRASLSRIIDKFTPEELEECMNDKVQSLSFKEFVYLDKKLCSLFSLISYKQINLIKQLKLQCFCIQNGENLRNHQIAYSSIDSVDVGSMLSIYLNGFWNLTDCLLELEGEEQYKTTKLVIYPILVIENSANKPQEKHREFEITVELRSNEKILSAENCNRLKQKVSEKCRQMQENMNVSIVDANHIKNIISQLAFNLKKN